MMPTLQPPYWCGQIAQDDLPVGDVLLILTPSMGVSHRTASHTRTILQDWAKLQTQRIVYNGNEGEVDTRYV